MREKIIGKIGKCYISVAEFASDDYRWCAHTVGTPVDSDYHAGCKTLKEAICMALDQVEESCDTLYGIKERSYIYLKDKKTKETKPFYVAAFDSAKKEVFGHWLGSPVETWIAMKDFEVVYRHVRLYVGDELLDFIGSSFTRRNAAVPGIDTYKAVAYIPNPPRLVLATPLHVGSVYEPSELAESFYRVDASKNLVDCLKIED